MNALVEYSLSVLIGGIIGAIAGALIGLTAVLILGAL